HGCVGSAGVHRDGARDPPRRDSADCKLLGTRSRVRSRLRAERGAFDARARRHLEFVRIRRIERGGCVESRVTPLPWCTAALFALGLAGQGTPQAAIAESAAWDALASGRSAAAAEAFRQALDSDPTNARSWLGVGMAAALERRDDAARTALERALALDPRLTRARALLGQVIGRSDGRDPYLRAASGRGARRSRDTGDGRALATRSRSARSDGSDRRRAFH